MIFGNSIGKRVAKVIKQRVADAQKAHDEHCKTQDEWCESMKKTAEEQARVKKEEHAEEMVGKILGR